MFCFCIHPAFTFAQTKDIDWPPPLLETVSCYEDHEAFLENLPPDIFDGDDNPLVPIDPPEIIEIPLGDTIVCGGTLQYVWEYYNQNDEFVGTWTATFYIEDNNTRPLFLNIDSSGFLPAILLPLDDSCEYSFDNIPYPLVQYECSDYYDQLTYTSDDLISEDICIVTVTRRWTVTDRCNNSRQALQNISFIDQSPPTLKEGSELPTDESDLNLCMSAVDDIALSAEEMADLFEDNCTEVFATRVSETTGDNCGWTVTYTYTVRDDCNNAIEVVIVYSGSNQDPPTIACPESPQIRVIPPGEASYIVEGGEFDLLEYVDACGETPAISNNLTGNEASLDGYEFSSQDDEVIVEEIVWTALDECGNVASCTFQVEIYDPGIELTKEATLHDINGDGLHSAGDEIHYVYLVNNTGNAALYDVELACDQPGVIIDDPLIGILEPGVAVSRTATYVITQDDIDAGSFTSIATVTGSFDITAETLYYTDNAMDTQEFLQEPSITIVKSADVDEESFFPPGSELTYFFEVINTGNITLTQPSVVDTLPEHTHFIGASHGGVYDEAAHSVTWVFDPVAPGPVATLTLTVQVDEDTPDDVLFIENQAVFESDQTGPVSSNILIILLMPPPELTLVEIVDVDCFGNATGSITVDFQYGVPPITITWDTDPPQTGETATNLAAGTYTAVAEDALGRVGVLSTTVNEPDLLEADSEQIDVLCFGDSTGAIILDVYGGVEPYSYTWNTGDTSNNFTDLPAGDYSVLINDANGCELFLEFTIAQPEALVAEAMVTDVSCYDYSDGTIELDISGGVPPYECEWNIEDTSCSLVNIPAGLYTVIITDANGCILEVEATVNQPDLLVADPIITPVACFGDSTGSIELDVSGGTPPYFFDWNTGDITKDLFAIPAGIYAVTITDSNGCYYELDNIIVPEYPELLIINEIIEGVDCKFDPVGSIIFDVEGGNPPYSFLWNTGDTDQNLYNIEGGDYSVTITDDNDCELVQHFHIPYNDDECRILVPGGLTPDGDGINDVLFIEYLHLHPQNSLRIYNRYGTKVFAASPYQNDWDGVPNRGQISTEADGRLPSGTYFYVLTLSPGEEPLTGYIYLLR